MTGTASHPFENEVEVMPGVYLIKRTAPASSQRTSGQRNSRAALPLLHGEATLSDNFEFLQAESARLAKSVEMLRKTNDELKQEDQSDPVIAEAISENIGVIERQMDSIRRIENMIQQLVDANGSVCLQQPRQPPVAAPSQSAANGNDDILTEEMEQEIDEEIERELAAQHGTTVPATTTNSVMNPPNQDAMQTNQPEGVYL